MTSAINYNKHPITLLPILYFENIISHGEWLGKVNTKKNVISVEVSKNKTN